MFKFNAFLSYSWANREIAEKLVFDLEDSTKTLNLLPRIKIFRDQVDAEQKKGFAEMNKGMDESEYLIILASNDSAKSIAVGDEVIRWKTTNRNIGNIIIVLLEGKINFKKEVLNGKNIFKLESDALNPKLQEIDYIIEPIWVNMSKIDNLLSQTRKAGFYRANLIEIVARILNTTSRQIENKESSARRILFGGLIIIAIALLGLSSFAFYQKNEAERERDKANTQKNIALDQTKKAKERLQQVELLRVKEFVRNAQIFKDAGGEIGIQKVNEMKSKADSIFRAYPDDAAFKKESLKLVDILTPKQI